MDQSKISTAATKSALTSFGERTTRCSLRNSPPPPQPVCLSVFLSVALCLSVSVSVSVSVFLSLCLPESPSTGKTINTRVSKATKIGEAQTLPLKMPSLITATLFCLRICVAQAILSPVNSHLCCQSTEKGLLAPLLTSSS